MFGTNGLFTLTDTDSDPDPSTDIYPKNGYSNDLDRSPSPSPRSRKSFCTEQCCHFESESELVREFGNVNKPKIPSEKVRQDITTHD